MSNKGQIQQGDVSIERVAGIPKGAKKVQARNGRFVLAEGEATGHAHTIEAEAGIEVYESDGTMYLHVETDDGVKVDHQEHHKVTLEPGDYQIGGVREKDYLEDEIRRVRD